MKLVFLDMDGVVVTAKSHSVFDEDEQGIWWSPDPIAIQALNNLVYAHDVKFVLSSTWRIVHGFKKTVDHLRENGLIDQFIGETPNAHYACRGEEIQEFLRALKEQGSEITDYLILDDNSDMLPEQEDHFIKTDCFEGMTYKNILDIRDFFDRHAEKESGGANGG